MYIVQSKVRQLIKQNGKRVSKSYLNYLDRRVCEIVLHHLKLMGSRVTMNVQDAEALDAFKMTRG